MKSLSTLLYPEPDSMFIYGSDNSSYWFILFVRVNMISSQKPVYFIGIAVESFFLICGIIFHGRSVFLLWKHKSSFHVLHTNLSLILTNFYITFQSGSVARLAMIVFETRLIKLPALGDAPLPQLGIVRSFSLAHAFCLLVFASFYVADYEKKRRYHIAIVIIAVLDILAALASYSMVTGILNGYITCVVSILPNFGCAFLLRLLLNWNRKRLASISHVLKRSANDEYSLSLRVQLKENIWSIQKIEFGMYLVIVGLTVNLLIITCPIFVLTEANQMETLQWWMWAANIILALSITLCVPMGTFAIGMHTGQLPFYARWYMKIFNIKEAVDVNVEKKETDTYFGQLHSQWDLAMRKTSVWKNLITSWKPLYYIGVVTEILFLICGAYLHGKGTLLIGKHKALHPNMILIYTNYYFSFHSGSVARIVLTLFETRLIRLQHLGSMPVPLLGIIRMFSVIHVFFYLYLATTERVFATLLVADYEKQQRHRFAVTVIIILDAVIVVISCSLVTGVFNPYICCLVSLCPCVACPVILRQLLKRNRKRLAKLSDTIRRSANDSYSLSLRMQLRENVWTLQKIEFGMYIVVICQFTNIALILVPIFILTEEYQMETLQWCQWAANILISVFITASVPMATFAVAMHTGNLPLFARWYLKIFGQEETIEVKSEKKETETHFHQLHNQWDLAMARGGRWKK